MYPVILFDLDGTLADTYPGICQSYRYAFWRLRLPFPGEDFVREAVGAPLPEVFHVRYGLTEDQSLQAVAYYRTYYDRRGKNRARAYPGVKEMLEELRGRGSRLGVATLKSRVFAGEILEKLGLLGYFDALAGMDQADTLTKADLIWLCLEKLGASPEEALLVGDSLYDEKGAWEAGTWFLPVTYGYGFCPAPGLRAASSPKQVAEFIKRGRPGCGNGSNPASPGQGAGLTVKGAP